MYIYQRSPVKWPKLCPQHIGLAYTIHPKSTFFGYHKSILAKTGYYTTQVTIPTSPSLEVREGGDCESNDSSMQIGHLVDWGIKHFAGMHH